jgi:nicotinamidase-related amidase
MSGDASAHSGPADAESLAWLRWLDEWYARLLPASLEQDVVVAAGGPERVAVLLVDLLAGFCEAGPLTSPRVAALLPRVTTFLDRALAAGVRHFLSAEDRHPPDSPEFAAFPPHCVEGTAEARPAAVLAEHPAYRQALVIPKRSLSVGLETSFVRWLAQRDDITHWVVAGDCTDLCVYQAAMHLRLHANATGRQRTVWVPATLVDTYDLPHSVAEGAGALPHPGDLMHRVFLYHLALNGVRVPRELGP